eukprot:PhF_6_TR22539/c0_g1_i1/m.32028
MGNVLWPMMCVDWQMQVVASNNNSPSPPHPYRHNPSPQRVVCTKKFRLLICVVSSHNVLTNLRTLRYPTSSWPTTCVWTQPSKSSPTSAKRPKSKSESMITLSRPSQRLPCRCLNATPTGRHRQRL